MAKVDKSDLTNINSNITILSTMSQDALNIAAQIKEFNNNSIGTLKGDAYNALRNRLEMYIDAYEKESQIFSNLEHNSKAVNNSMINYMEEFNTLDDSYIEQTQDALNRAEKQLEYLINLVNSSRLTASQKQQIKESIAVLKQEIARLKRLLEKLNGLQPKDNELDSQLSATKEDVEKYATAINEIAITNYV